MTATKLSPSWVFSTVLSGHPWWRRWSPPSEFIILWVETPDFRDTDTWILRATWTTNSQTGDRGQFRWIGETYQLTWLDDITTQAMRRTLHIEDV